MKTKEEVNSIHMTLIAGLGNPGAEYENTYHNVGMRAIDFLLEKYKSTVAIKKTSLVRGFFEYTKTPRAIFVKPHVFMNESGKSIAKALRFFSIKPENMIVIHDDSDLYVGDFKMSFGSGSAGHKGIESLIEHLGTKNFFRVRVGIRTPEEDRKRRQKASELVLKNVPSDDQKQFARVFKNIENTLEERAIDSNGM